MFDSLIIEHNIPLTIRIFSYHPETFGRLSGPPELAEPPEPAEIEFEVLTLSGHPLSESDFDESTWEELYSAVLTTYEDQLANLRVEACVEEWERQQDARADYDSYILDNSL